MKRLRWAECAVIQHGSGGDSNMSLRMFHIAALVAGCAVLGARAEEGDGMVAEKGDGAKQQPGDSKKDNRKKERPKGGGGFQQPMLRTVLDHEAELKLTADQKKQLAELRSKNEALLDDPEIKELQKQMMEARKAQDKEKTQELRKAFRQKIEAKGGMNEDGMFAALKKILTEEQMAKLKDLRPAGDGPANKQERKEKREAKEGKGDGKMEEPNRADPGKGPPPLYEHERETK
jgi:hypothetical protein